MKILDATFKDVRQSWRCLVQRCNFQDENGAVHIEVEPKAYIHMNSKTANAYKDALTELLKIGKDYSDENQMIIPGNY